MAPVFPPGSSLKAPSRGFVGVGRPSNEFAMLRQLLLTAGLATSTLLARTGTSPARSRPSACPPASTPPAPLLRPEDQLKTFRLPPGFHAEIVAAEPLITTPVAVQFDHLGRLWVVEMNGYMQVPDGTGEQEPNGKIVILEDTDGDGRMDRRTVFLDHLVMPRAVMLYRDGALVAEPPRVWFARDTDGDGKADEKTLAFEDFATENDPKLGAKSNPEHASNTLMWALDNWIYAANHRMRYRNVDGTWRKEPTIFRGQWGLPGRLRPPVPQLELRSPPRRSRPQPLPDAQPEPPESLRRKRPAPEGPARLAGAGEPRREPRLPAQPTHARRPPRHLHRRLWSGYFYRGDQFPAEYVGNAFYCEPTANLVSRISSAMRTALLSARNPYEKDEFLRPPPTSGSYWSTSSTARTAVSTSSTSPAA